MRVRLDLLEECVLPRVDKPGRYAGCLENLNLVSPQGRVRVLLTAPEPYESGLSRLGLRQFLAALGGIEAVAADITFAPAADFRAELERHDLPWHGLGTRTPASNFPLVVLYLARESLQLEVIPGLVAMRITPLAQERGAGEPVVAICGPGATNPLPLSRIADLSLGCEPGAALERAIEFLRASPAGSGSRCERMAGLLQAVLADSPGNLARPAGDFGIAPRSAPGSATPLLPPVEIHADRLRVALFTGCSPDCEACASGAGHAGLTPRPAEEVLDEVVEGFRVTGWEEIELVGVPHASAPDLPAILLGIERELAGRPFGLSVEPIFASDFSEHAADVLSRHRRRPLVLTALSGSEALRARLGLHVSDEELLRAVRLARRMGWSALRLQFRLGLPGETDADREAIAALVRRVTSAAAENASGAARTSAPRLTVGLEPWVPRDCTAPELRALPDPGCVAEGLAALRKRLTRVRVSAPQGAERLAPVEARLACGGGDAADALVAFHAAGGRLSTLAQDAGWELWTDAFAGLRLNSGNCDARQACARSVPGERASARPAGDARTAPAASGGRLFGRKPRRAARAAWQRGLRFRVEYRKGEEARFTSHLDLMRTWERAMRRCGLPVAYSQGQTPHARIASGPPLALGFTGLAEYLDVEFTRSVDESFLEELNATLCRGLAATEACVLGGREASLSGSIDTACWRIWLPPYVLSQLGRDADSVVARWNLALHEIGASRDPVLWAVKPVEGAKQLDVRGMVRGVKSERRGDMPEMRFETPAGGGMRPEQFAALLTGLNELDPRLVRVERTGLWVTRGTRRLTPLMAIAATPGALAAATDWT